MAIIRFFIIVGLFSLSIVSVAFAQSMSSNEVQTKVGNPAVTTPTGDFSCPLAGKHVIGCGSFMSDPQFNTNACSGAQPIDRGHIGRNYGGYLGSIEATNASRRAHSIDVNAPAGETVYLPTIQGQRVAWEYSPAGTGMSYPVDPNDGGGFGNVFFTTVGGDKWIIHLLHTSPPPLIPPPPGGYHSGDPVTTIALTGYTHLHINIGKNPAGANGGAGWLNPEELGMCAN